MTTHVLVFRETKQCFFCRIAQPLHQPAGLRTAPSSRRISQTLGKFREVMTRHWKEKLDPSKHRDFMRGYQDAGGLPLDAPPDNLLESWVYFVEVARFTFQFVSVDQICEALRYFEEGIHPSTKEYNNGLEHYWQPEPVRILV